LTTRKPDKNARNSGNQICSPKAGSPAARKIPAREKKKTASIMTIKDQQAKDESYQGVMTFLKKGF